MPGVLLWYMRNGTQVHVWANGYITVALVKEWRVGVGFVAADVFQVVDGASGGGVCFPATLISRAAWRQRPVSLQALLGGSGHTGLREGAQQRRAQ